MLDSNIAGKLLVLFIVLFSGSYSHADGSVVDKVYHPYVEPLEWELEWRMVQENKNPITGQHRPQSHKFGLGKAVTETIFIEGYLIANQSANDSFSAQAYEVEALWQISEQGEYAVDMGILFELEKVKQDNVWEHATTLLLEKEHGRFSTTANLALIYEWGEGVNDEWETSLALQTRYRYSPRFEPAVEFYSGENSRALGPVIVGMERLGDMKSIRWELGSIFGLTSDTPDYTLRGVLEYEFSSLF